MSQYLVDTDWIIDAIHQRSEATARLAALSSAGLAVSLITYGELYEGAFYARNQAESLDGVRQALSGIVVLPLTEAIMERFAVVRGGLTRPLRQQIGDLDLLIAATALVHDLTLLTRNLRDFRHVPGLQLFGNDSS